MAELLKTGTRVRVTFPPGLLQPSDPQVIEGTVERSWVSQVYDPPETLMVVQPDRSSWEVCQSWCEVLG